MPFIFNPEICWLNTPLEGGISSDSRIQTGALWNFERRTGESLINTASFRLKNPREIELAQLLEITPFFTKGKTEVTYSALPRSHLHRPPLPREATQSHSFCLATFEVFLCEYI
jgi:hypothetical protein